MKKKKPIQLLCDVCIHKKSYTTGKDEYPALTTIEYCGKNHWEGACEPEPSQEDFWKNCKDYSTAPATVVIL